MGKLNQLLLSFVCFGTMLLAQEDDWRAGIAADEARLAAQKERDFQEWQQMLDRESGEWRAHVAQIKQFWPDANVSDVARWIGYSPDYRSRFNVDFRQGNLTIEVIDSSGTSRNELSGKAGDVLQDVLDDVSPVDGRPVLADQLVTDPGLQDVRDGHSEITPTLLPDGSRGVKLTLTLPFLEDHIARRAERYEPLVRRFARPAGIEAPLVMAVIHAESTFNPRAISTFPRTGGRFGHAIGLMQLVPFSGGREAHEHLGFQGEPSRELLLNPEKNIELGIAYLQKLSTHYFGRVTEADNRRHAVVAAYNTGPGNVALALDENRSLATAVNRINAMTAGGLYRHLLEHLAFAEARRYLRDVTELYQHYAAAYENRDY